MKHLKSYPLYEAVQDLSPDQIEWLDKCTKGRWKLNPQTGLVDVKGNFNCEKQRLTDFKGVKFGRVSGRFYCDHNLLTSLEGAPQEVGSFYCYVNRLTSLVGAPQKVRGVFSCFHNLLTSLEGAPQKVGSDFDCTENQLTSLVGAPQEVGGGFYCFKNRLTSLEGAPQGIDGVFNCSKNRLTSLEGAPREVSGVFYAGNNPVSDKTLDSIFWLMKGGQTYLQAVEKIWNEISIEDQVLMYNDQFKWVGAEEAKKLKTLARYNQIKSML